MEHGGLLFRGLHNGCGLGLRLANRLIRLGFCLCEDFTLLLIRLFQLILCYLV
ncbi:MAG: hypothetical protein IJT83_13135 [Victivallales bacterium]|nr:hypothetical protein [Victivallales bacterium]